MGAGACFARFAFEYIVRYQCARAHVAYAGVWASLGFGVYSC